MRTDACAAAVVMLLSAAALAAPRVAEAAPLPWTLSGVTFEDGGKASGTFDFDAVTGAYSDVAIATTAGSSFAGATYSAALPSPISAPGQRIAVTTAALTDYTGAPALLLAFDQRLTGTGGTVPLTASASDGGSCLNSGCTNIGLDRDVSAGSVTAAAPVGVLASVPASVPEPGSLWVLGGGVLGLGLVRRRRKAA